MWFDDVIFNGKFELVELVEYQKVNSEVDLEWSKLTF